MSHSHRCAKGGDVGEIRDEDLKGIFREFDLNGDGFIQRDELRSVMQKMGQSPTEEELDAMFNAADQDHDGNIDFKVDYPTISMISFKTAEHSERTMVIAINWGVALSEFLQIAHANPLSLSLKAVFEELDVDGDGYITRSELRTAFQRMGHSLSDQDIKAIYKHVDANNDGKINFQGEV
ncbi:EF hand [Ancylostoma caninum]|uniref:EF hand n=1 Tax=Ancylostoma caninum TaxID=29170 RepID=A0A368G0L1_ANCCA|nr:EF hand [Ancylostoma caninum]